MPIHIKDEEMSKYIDSVRYQTGHVTWKDVNSSYLAMTTPLAITLGFTDPEQIIGKSDYDLQCKAAESASIFQEDDRITFASKNDAQLLAFNRYNDGWKLLFAAHTLVYQSEEPVALIVTATDITHHSILNLGVGLNYTFFDKIQKRKPFQVRLTDQYPNLNLTHKQSKILFYHLQGYPAKKIGTILALSHRTIERHIENIKVRLDCQSRDQLVEKAIDSGLLNYFITD